MLSTFAISRPNLTIIAKIGRAAPLRSIHIRRTVLTARESQRAVYRSLTMRPTAIPQGSDNSVKGPEMVALGTTLP